MDKITIPQSLINKRTEEIKNLVDLVIEDNETYKANIYKELKQYYNKAHTKNIARDNLLNISYSAFASAISITLTEAETIFDQKASKADPLDVEDLLYTEDGKTLEDRVDTILDLPLETMDNLEYCFYRMCLILDTEDYRIIFNTIRKKYDVDYVVIHVCACDCDGLCTEYADGEPHRADEVAIPPFHVNCHCKEVPFLKSEVIGDL